MATRATHAAHAGSCATAQSSSRHALGSLAWSHARSQVALHRRFRPARCMSCAVAQEKEARAAAACDGHGPQPSAAVAGDAVGSSREGMCCCTSRACGRAACSRRQQTRRVVQGHRRNGSACAPICRCHSAVVALYAHAVCRNMQRAKVHQVPGGVCCLLRSRRHAVARWQQTRYIHQVTASGRFVQGDFSVNMHGLGLGTQPTDPPVRPTYLPTLCALAVSGDRHRPLAAHSQ